MNLNLHPPLPARKDSRIGILGSGLIVSDCHLVSYRRAGFNHVHLNERELRGQSGGGPPRSKTLARYPNAPEPREAFSQWIFHLLSFSFARPELLMNLNAMRFWPIGCTFQTKRNFFLKIFVVLIVSGALGFSLGGCKLFMPPGIKSIEQTLGARAQTLATNHLSTAHDYTVDGRTMHYVEAGTNGAVPLILFVHGSPGEWKAWAQYLSDPDLSTRAHMIAVDRPGFGGSEAGKVESSLEQQCRDIAPLLDRGAPGQRVVLVGHSFGGPVICRLAMDHPDQITDLIVLAGSIDPGQEQTKWYQYAAKWWIFRWLVPTELQMANCEIMPLKGGLTEMMPLWPKIRQRVTVIQGLADNLVPPENADFAQRMMINARTLKIIRIPGMNHFLPWKQYPLVKKTILEHLQQG